MKKPKLIKMTDLEICEMNMRVAEEAAQTYFEQWLATGEAMWKN